MGFIVSADNERQAFGGVLAGSRSHAYVARDRICRQRVSAAVAAVVCRAACVPRRQARILGVRRGILRSSGRHDVLSDRLAGQQRRRGRQPGQRSSEDDLLSLRRADDRAERSALPLRGQGTFIDKIEMLLQNDGMDEGYINVLPQKMRKE